MADRKTYDWEAIEKEYRGGVLSIRQIATNHGCSDTAIRKKAKAEDWERDLSAKVAAKVRNDLVRNEVRTANRIDEKDIVVQAATIQIEVIKGHRVKIRKANETVEKLQKQLDVLASQDTVDSVELNRNASTANSLANSLKTFIGLQRQAFNITSDDQGQQENGITEITWRIVDPC